MMSTKQLNLQQWSPISTDFLCKETVYCFLKMWFLGIVLSGICLVLSRPHVAIYRSDVEHDGCEM